MNGSLSLDALGFIGLERVGNFVKHQGKLAKRLHVGAPSQWVDKWKLLLTRCKHITAEHRKNWNHVKSPSSHAEMIADQTNGKTYANCSNSSALAGHSNDAVF